MAAQAPLEWQGKILHATLTLGDHTLAGVDHFGKEYEPAKGFFALMEVNDPAPKPNESSPLF